MDNELVDISTSYKLQLGYGVGHVLNDVCASLWFTYFLVFFNVVLKFSSNQSGILMLIGQIADGLATAFTGYYSDHTDGTLRYGKRKIWHLFGSTCVLASFPFIFSECIGCSMAHKWAQMVYYSAFIIIFQIGWAATQISHLSLVPELTSDDHVRLQLNAVRHGFTVFSNLFVFLVTLFVIRDKNKQICPGDESKFHMIVLVVLSVGILATILFHVIVKERTVVPRAEDESVMINQSERSGIQLNFFTQPSLYIVAMIYMSTRLVVNISQLLMPLYLHHTLGLSAKALALVPLSMYLGSLAAAGTQRLLPRSVTRKVNYAFGVMCAIPAYFWIYFGEGDYYKTYFIYIIAVLMGFGGATLLVTSLSITADLVGSVTEASAFVYGLMSFTDKCTCGVTIAVIQLYADQSSSSYYRIVFCWVCASAAVIGLIFTMALPKLGNRNDPLLDEILDTTDDHNS